MERQNRLLSILAVVLLVVIAAIAIDNQQNGGKTHSDDPHAPDTHELVDYKPEEITKLTVQDADAGAVTFEKSGSAWTMVDPKQVPIEERKVSEIVDRFDPVKVEERELTGDPAGYGLDPATRAVVTLATADGRTWTVYVGKATPVGYGTYVQTAEGGPVGVAQTHLDVAHRKLDDFRSKTVWSISAGTARRIQIDVGDKRVVLRKDDHGWWQGDEGPRVDESAVKDWLQKADLVRAESFDDRPVVDLATTATLSVEDADGVHTLAIGDATGEGEGASVTVMGEGPLANVAPTVRDLVKVDGWAGTALLPVNSYQVDSVAIVLGDYKTTLTKTDGAWKDAAGKPVAFGDGVLEQIKATHADRTAVPAGAATGWGSITLTESAGGTPHSEAVTLGAASDGGVRPAKDVAGGPAFTVLQADLDVLLGVSRGTLPPPKSAQPETPEGMGLEGFEGLSGLQGLQ